MKANPGTSKHPKLELQIDANVIRQLGDQLITDAEQALLELVKNSYDADASKVRVTIDTEATPAEGLNIPEERWGKVSIWDNGHGMDINDIQRGWLTVSLSPKRQMKELGGVTLRYGRTPMGDKGLGRLGSMKIGNNLMLTSYSSPEKDGIRVSFSWDQCQPGRLLSDVPIAVEYVPAIGGTGTELVIQDLVDKNYWRGSKRSEALRSKMSALIFPFDEISNFKINFSINDLMIDLDSVTAVLRDTASARFRIKWDDSNLEIEGACKANLFFTNRKEYERHVLFDNGVALTKYLMGQKAAVGYKLQPDSNGAFLRFRGTYSWNDMASLKDDEVIRKPGPFHGEINSFDLKEYDSAARLLLSPEAYKATIKEWAGIGVYRDGFAIRMHSDWLELGSAWTSGRSWYGLKPANTVGYVLISGRGNPSLVEKSDREGFIDTPESRGFIVINKRAVKFCNDVFNFLRRSFSEFKDGREITGSSTTWTVDDAEKKIKTISSEASRVKKKLRTHSERLEAMKRQVATVQQSAKSLNDSVLGNKAASAMEFVESAMENLQEERADIERVLELIVEVEGLAASVRQRVAALEEQSEILFDTVAIGIAARAWAHELSELLDALVIRTQKLRERKDLPTPVIAYTEAVKSTVQVLRKQVSLLDPLIRSNRERKTEVALGKFLEDYVELRQTRSDLPFQLRLEKTKDFRVKLSQGRLFQVVDNLVRNSEYWLREFSKRESRSDLAVTLQIDDPRLVVSDNGYGINPMLEDTLFDLFVSDKPREIGTGLGLYIVRSILEREGCSIRLDPKRNEFGRRYIFEINLLAVRE